MYKISVIVPIYKVEEYLPRCINSILSQTYTNFELILVDDGSPDHCGAICDEYANKDKRIQVVHKANGGLSDARNAGLDVAKGEYVVFIDSDDYVERDLFEKGVSILKTNPHALVSYGYFLEDGIENRIQVDRLPKITKLTTDTKKIRFICNELCDYRMIWNVWSIFFNREVIEKYKMRFADNKKIFAEDLYFSLCYLPLVNEIITIPEPMYHYITRNDSIMGNDVKKCNTASFEKLTEAVHSFYASNEKTNHLMKYFPLIYYKVINHAAEKDITFLNCFQFKDIIEKEIYNKVLFRSYINKAWKMRSFLHNEYANDMIHEEKLSYLKYLCDNSLLRYKIRNKLIYRKYKR